MKTIFIFLIGNFCIVGAVICQNNPDFDKVYKTNIPLHQDVVSGGYFVDPPRQIEGHPYWENRVFEEGTITINGLAYSGIPLLYNIYTDEVITFQPIHKQKILIRTDKINQFTLQVPYPVQFVRLDQLNNYANHRNGIYELIESGKAKLLCKYYKTTKLKRELGNFTSEFVDKAEYLLQVDQDMVPINNAKQAYEFLGIEKRDVKSALKDRSLRFRQDKRAFLIFLTDTFNANYQ